MKPIGKAVWVILLPLMFAIVACTWGADGRPMGYWGRGMHSMGYGGFFMWLFVVIIAAVVIYFVFYRAKDTDRRNEIHSSENALDIVKKRYARGEISKEEFERLKKDLE